MPNDYLTFDEVCETLGKSAEEVNALVAQGQLSEVRDAGMVYYKRGEVEQIAAKEGSSIVDLAATEDLTAEPADADSFASALSSLADSSSGLDLRDDSPVKEAAPEGDAAKLDEAALPSPAELSVEDFPEELPAAPQEAAAGGGVVLDDASEIDLIPADEGTGSEVELAVGSPEVPDLGLSGSSIINLEAPSDEKVAEAAPPAEGTPAGKKVGISVFDDDELEIESDPMGETQVTTSVGDMDAVGSGSGLLDLTRESDDTSLGPDLLDVLSPSEAEDTQSDTVEDEQVVDGAGMEAAVAEEQPFETAAAVAAPRIAASSTTGEIPLMVSALFGVLALALLGLATTAQLQGVWPAFMDTIAGGIVHYAVFGGVALVALVAGILGIMAGKDK